MYVIDIVMISTFAFDSFVAQGFRSAPALFSIHF